MPNTAISEVISGFVEVTDGDIQTSLVLWKFCSFLCQCFYMECNENWTIRGGFDSRRNPARCSTRLREISFYLCSRCKIKGMLKNTEKNHYFQRKYVEGISVDLSAPAWVLSEGIQGKVRWLWWEDFEFIFILFIICVMMMTVLIFIYNDNAWVSHKKWVCLSVWHVLSSLFRGVCLSVCLWRFIPAFSRGVSVCLSFILTFSPKIWIHEDVHVMWIIVLMELSAGSAKRDID